MFFFRFDADGDGSITRSELKKIVVDIYHMLNDQEKVDVDKIKGEASKSEKEEMEMLAECAFKVWVNELAGFTDLKEKGLVAEYYLVKIYCFMTKLVVLFKPIFHLVSEGNKLTHGKFYSSIA